MHCLVRNYLLDAQKQVVGLLQLGLLAYSLIYLGLALLSPNPIASLLDRTGILAIQLLLGIFFLGILLAKFPLDKAIWTGFRRRLGLFSFVLVLGHLVIYLLLDQFFDWQEIWRQALQLTYLQIGYLAFLLFLPLVFTSSESLKQALGKQWKRIHQLIWLIMPLSLWHYYLVQKFDYSGVFLYSGLFGVLVIYVWVYPRLRHFKK